MRLFAEKSKEACRRKCSENSASGSNTKTSPAAAVYYQSDTKADTGSSACNTAAYSNSDIKCSFNQSYNKHTNGQSHKE